MRTVEGVDAVELGRWLDRQGFAPGPVEGLAPLTGGTQNILLRFRRGAGVYVLRRPPLHPRPGSDETIRREIRVLRALAGSPVPHGRLVAASDGSDLAVSGTAFHVCEFVPGANPTELLPDGYRRDAAWRREIGLRIVDVAAAVGALDHRAAGLDGFGRPGGFLGRQVARWQAQLDSYRTLPGYAGTALPGLAEIIDWLPGAMPATGRVGLLHGDFHLANILVRADRPAVAAVVDWELSTVGDPLVDLGWLLATWPDESGRTAAGRTVTPFDGFPTRADLIARYAERSGRDLTGVAWYEVLACYKLAVILEGTHARACAGQAHREVGDRLHRSALALLERGVRRMRNPTTG